MSHWNEDTNEHPTPMQAGLEMWARRLDEQRYPGQAWPPATRPRRQAPASRSTWWIATGVVAATLTFAVALRPPRRSVEPGTLPEAVAERGFSPPGAPDAAPAAGVDAPLPHVFMVEDRDSYSIITVTNAITVVSFATKDGSGPDWLVTLPLTMAASDR